MSDLKSKLPDLKEISSMANKLFKSLKSTVEEIVHDYKEKRAEPAHEAPAKKETKTAKKETKKE